MAKKSSQTKSSDCVIPMYWLAKIMEISERSVAGQCSSTHREASILDIMTSRMKRAGIPMETRKCTINGFAFGHAKRFITVETAMTYANFAKDPEAVRKEIQKVAKDPRYAYPQYFTP